MIDVMLAATHTHKSEGKKKVKPHKHERLTWIERRLCYPKFKPRDERHPNANPKEHEGIREPFPPRVRFERPIRVHTPEGDERRKPEPHDAVNVRLYHPAERLGRIVIHCAAWWLEPRQSEQSPGKKIDITYTVATMWPMAEGYFSPGLSCVNSEMKRESGG